MMHLLGSPRYRLASLCLLALLLRIVRLLFFAPVVEGDGVEYCRLAENLARGVGYVGMLPGPELMFPPLYPATIAALRFGTGQDAVILARLVSLVAGLLTLVFLYRFSVRRFGERTALWVGLLTAGHVGLVVSSSAAFTESFFLVFVTAALGPFSRAAAERRVLPAAVSGALLGLAYLARAEALALGGLMVFVLLLGWPRRGAPSRPSWKPALAMGITLAMLTLPYVAYLHGITGKLRFEGKSERVLATVERYAQGIDHRAANYELGPNGEELGPWLSPNVPWTGVSKGDILARSWKSILERLGQQTLLVATKMATGHTVVSLLWLPFVLLAFRRSKERDRETRAADLMLLGLVALGVVGVVSYKWVLRYLVPVAIPAIIWAARGLESSLARSRATSTAQVRLGLAAILLLLLSVSRGLVTGLREYDEASHQNVRFMEFGRSLASDDPRPLIGRDPRVAFYAGAQWLPLPVAPNPTALRAYAARHNARALYLELDESEFSGSNRPGPWFDPTNPPSDFTKLQGGSGFQAFGFAP